MLPTSDGRGPENELYAKFRLEDREGSKTSLGIEPFNRWFSDRSRRYKFLSLPRLGGTGPSKLLLYAIIMFSRVRFPSDDGMSPDNLVLYKAS